MLEYELSVTIETDWHIDDVLALQMQMVAGISDKVEVTGTGLSKWEYDNVPAPSIRVPRLTPLTDSD